MHQNYTPALVRLSLLLMLPFCAIAQTPIPNSTPVIQNFNAIGTTATAALPANWKMSSAGTGSASNWLTGTNVTSATQAASSGTPTMGGRYNWATTAGIDRSIGFMTDGSYASPNSIMAYYKNTTGSAISSLNISFNVEQYRRNTDAASVSIFTSTDGVTWTFQQNVNFSSGASSYSFTSPPTLNAGVIINSFVVPNNGNIYLRWVFNTGGPNSHGLGLDDVSVTATLAPPDLSARLGAHVNDANANGTANPGETITYRDTVKNSGSGAAGSVTVTYPANANADYVANSIQTSALARDDAYSITYGVTLTSQNVISNDYGLPSPTVASYGTTLSKGLTTPVGSLGATDNGGTISITAAGVITYNPPAGFCGEDKFMYVATTGVAGLPNNDAVVTITVNSNITFTTTDVAPCNAQTNGSITVNAPGATGAYTYSKDGGSNFQPSNVFTGLTAGTYNIVVKDGTCTATGISTLASEAAIGVSGDIPNQVIYTAITPVSFTKTNGVGAPSNPWSATGLPTGVNISTATGVVSGTPTVTGNFSATITYTDANGCTGSITDAFNVAPKLVDDAYNVVGNTQLVVDGHSSPLTPHTTSSTKILANDEPATPPGDLSVTAGTFPTQNGGSITIDATGKFTYTPPVDVTGPNADSYTYTATSNNVSATAKINFTITDMVWYVRSAAPNGGDGRSNTPFNTMTAANAASTNNGDFIYVHQGTPTGAYTMKLNQKLIGAGATLHVPVASPVLTIAGNPASTPTLDNTITLANGVTVNGIDMLTGTNPAITGASVNPANVTARTVSTSSGAGISITGSGNNVTINLSRLNTVSAVNAVTLTSTAGSVTINSGIIAGGAGARFNIIGGTVSLTYSGDVSQATATQPLVSISGGHATGTITFTGTLNSTNGTGLQFNNADGIYNFNGFVSLSGGNAGIGITNGSEGSFTFLNAPITNSTGIGFEITNSGCTVNHTGNISHNAAGNRAVSIVSNTNANITINNQITLSGSSLGIAVTNNSGTSATFNGNLSSFFIALTAINVSNNTTSGTVAFNGASKSFSTSTATAVSLATNTGVAINFANGGLVINTTNATGFNATGGGTISVTGTGNTITSTTGTALNVVSTNIGASGLTFQSISSAGSAAPNGIILNTTGSSGGLTVTGTGTAGSGGTIANKTGADLSTTQGTGIYLTNCSNISLSYMQLNDFSNFAIRGDAVNNFTLAESNVTGTNGTSDAVDECSIRFGTQGNDGTGNGLTGTAVFTGNNITGGFTDNLNICNNNTGTLNISFADGTSPAIFGLNANGGNDGLYIETRGNGGAAGAGFNLTVTVDGVAFTGARGDMVQIVAASNTTQNITVKNNSFLNAHTNISSGGGGVYLGGAGNTSNYVATYNVTNNTFKGAKGTALACKYLGQSATVSGIILNNIIGTPNGVYNNTQGLGGSTAGGEGINVVSEKFAGSGLLKHAVRIEGNVVADISGAGGGIHVVCNNTSGGVGLVEATVLNNNVTEMGTASSGAFVAQVGGADVTDIGQMGLNIIGNTFNNSGGSGGLNNAVLIDQVSTSAHYYFPGYSGSATGEGYGGTASVNLSTFLANASHNNTMINGVGPNNNTTGGVDAYTASGITGGGFTLPVPLMVEMPTGFNLKASVERLTRSQLDPLIHAAIMRWTYAGASKTQLEKMRKVSVAISDIPGISVATSNNTSINVDSYAAGHGWFIDQTPFDDTEFNINSIASSGKIDLLTVLMHELGHQVGLADEYQPTNNFQLMYGYLNPGERKVPKIQSVKSNIKTSAFLPGRVVAAPVISLTRKNQVK